MRIKKTLQYDINREAAKISALSSGKIDKYEYLTGEEILPSNKPQIIEKAKFTCSPLGKAFEKQTKTIEDQTKVNKDEKEQSKETEKQLDKYDDIKKGSLPINKQREIFNELVEKRKETMRELHNSVIFDSLLYHYKGSTKDKDFNTYNDTKSLFDMIKNKDITLSHTEENQAGLKSNLGEIKMGVKKKQCTKKCDKKCSEVA